MKPPKLVVADSFSEQLASLERDLPQAIILAGPDGIGLGRLAEHVAGKASLVVRPTEPTKTTKGSIGIDLIRSLYTETRGSTTSRQVIIIDEADRMSEPAQNAFLKLLEEPGRNVYFILTSHHPELLLPTIRSRAPTVRVPEISSEQSRQLIQPYQLTPEETKQVLFVASGRPAELVRLAINKRLRDELVQTMRDARLLLGPDRYTAYQVALRYATSLIEANRLLDATRRLLEHAISRSQGTSPVERLAQLIETHERIQRGSSPKLQLAQFVVQ